MFIDFEQFHNQIFQLSSLQGKIKSIKELRVGFFDPTAENADAKLKLATLKDRYIHDIAKQPAKLDKLLKKELPEEVYDKAAQDNKDQLPDLTGKTYDYAYWADFFIGLQREAKNNFDKEGFGLYTRDLIFRFLGIRENFREIAPNDDNPFCRIWEHVCDDEYLSAFIPVLIDKPNNEQCKKLLTWLAIKTLIFAVSAFEAEYVYAFRQQQERKSFIHRYCIPATKEGKSPVAGLFRALKETGKIKSLNSLALLIEKDCANDLKDIERDLKKLQAGHEKGKKIKLKLKPLTLDWYEKILKAAGEEMDAHYAVLWSMLRLLGWAYTFTDISLEEQSKSYKELMDSGRRKQIIYEEFFVDYNELFECHLDTLIKRAGDAS